MWTTNKNFQARGFSTPPPPTGKLSRWSPGSPMRPLSEKKPSSSQAKADLFHVIHKVPAGDSPYVRAKHVQLIEKDPSRAISLFWAAINSGDRVDSALKDMAVVMKQLNRSDEAIEAIKSFRHLCPLESQESLDNVLVELYKRSGRIEEQIEMLQCKVKIIEGGMAFGGKRTKSARSQGKKVQITVEQEYSRLLGNLAWAYLQQNNFKPAEELYRKALSLEPDKNKQCNLAICLMHMDRLTEAKFLLQTIRASPINGQLDDSFARSFERAIQMLTELESKSGERPIAAEEESHKEIRTPFTSIINRNSEEVTAFKNGSQNYVSGSRISVFGHDKEAPLLHEQDRGSCFQSQHEKKNNFFVSDRGLSKDTSFGLGNCSQSSPRTSYVDSLKKGSYSENQYERTADFGSKRNDKWKRAYVSPVPARGIPKVPFTQPRRGSLSFNCGDQRMAFWGDGVVGGCNRKLSFEQSRTHENFDRQQLPASTNELSKAALRKSESGSPCVRGDCRKRLWRDLAEENDESALEPILNRESERNSGENDGQKNLVMKDESAFSKGDWHRSSNICTAGSGRLTETFEINSSIKNNSGNAACSHEPIENVKPTQELQSQIHPIAAQDIFTCKSKKSWADMVEEDEQELSGRNQCPESSLVYPSHESSFSSQTPSRGSDGWNSGEEFDDENINSNITYQMFTPLDQIENLSQKIESCDLKDGYYTQPENATSSMNRTVRRSLCFDQQQKPGRTDNYCPSPLPKKVLNYEGDNSLLGNESEYISGSGIKLLRRNRLKVFRDITLSSESPRP